MKPNAETPTGRFKIAGEIAVVENFQVDYPPPGL